MTAELDDREINNTAIFGSKVSMLSSGVSHNQGNIKQAKWSSDPGQYWFVLKKPYRERLVEVRHSKQYRQVDRAWDDGSQISTIEGFTCSRRHVLKGYTVDRQLNSIKKVRVLAIGSYTAHGVRISRPTMLRIDVCRRTRCKTSAVRCSHRDLTGASGMSPSERRAMKMG